MNALSPAIEGKLLDLCNTIAQDAEVRRARDKAEEFLADEKGVAIYREVVQTSRDLEERHRNGEDISDKELQGLEVLRNQADSHEGIQSFNEAQQLLQGVATRIDAYVTKTLESGRVPSEDELKSGGCGSGCGCHH